METATIILAAGNSSRLGEPKQLINFNGVSLLQRISSIALNTTLGPVIVVKGQQKYPLSPHPRLQTVVNLEWEKGMGNSLKLGLKTLMDDFQVEQVLVLLSDQPMVNEELIHVLLDSKAKGKRPIAAAFYQNSPGVPAIFDKSVFKMIVGMPDKQGAKKILLSNPGLVSLVKFDAGKIDIDTPEDLLALQQSNWEHFNN